MIFLSYGKQDFRHSYIYDVVYIVHIVFFIHSENQQFLKDVIQSVLDGQGVGFWKLNRVKKLMEDENYRNFVVSRLNTSLDRKLTEDDQHIEDVVSADANTKYCMQYSTLVYFSTTIMEMLKLRFSFEMYFCCHYSKTKIYSRNSQVSASRSTSNYKEYCLLTVLCFRMLQKLYSKGC